MPNSLNRSSNGEPGGNSKGNGLILVTTVCVVEIFTTEGINFSARSAKDSGTDFAFTKDVKLANNIAIRNTFIFLNFSLFF